MTRCKREFPDLSRTELQSMARTAEEDAYHQALSKAMYQSLCQQACSRPPRSEESNDDQQPNEIDNTTETLMPIGGGPVEQIGRYTASYHAQGISSTVYKAISPDSGKTVAIKLTTPHRMSAPHNSKREARLLRLAAACPAVIPLIQTEQIAGGHFLLIFPFLPCDLTSILHNNNNLSLTVVVPHLKSMFTALAHIHSLGILHRDIKPSNILLASPQSGPAFLADFGIAWRGADDEDPDPDEPADHKITDVGTTCYRAPELLFGYTRYGAGVDLWAAGCVVAEALLRNGKSLFDAGDLGSELALLRSIFTTLGTPDERVWPEVVEFPDWGKMQFTEYPRRDWVEVLPEADPLGRELVSRLVRYQSTERMAAEEVLKHAFFQDSTTQEK